MGLSLTPAYALIARNLAIAAGAKKDGEPLVAACSACYLNLAKADHYMGSSRALNERVNDALDAGGLHYDPGTVEVRHLLEVIMNDVGLDAGQGGRGQAADRPEGRALPRLHAAAARPRPPLDRTTSSPTTSTGCWRPSAPTSWTSRSRPSAAAAT